MHRIPALWEFHKVHHSAEVLTPITFYRSHPVDMLVQTVAEALASGIVTSVFLYVFGSIIERFVISPAQHLGAFDATPVALYRQLITS